MNTYTATARRDGRHWVVKIDDLPVPGAAVTQGKSWKDAEHMAAEAVALLLDAPEDSIRIELLPEDPEMREAILRYRRARERAREAQKKANEEKVTTARLLARKATVRDVAAMLDVSHQYVSRLAPKPKD